MTGASDHSSEFSGQGPQPDSAEIRGQLDRILEHRDFEASERIRHFLRFVVEEALAGRGQRLKAYVIAVEVFARAPDFDADLDPIVRIQAGRLRRALEHYYLVAGGEDPVVIEVPKGGYAPIFRRRPVRTAITNTHEAPRADDATIAVLPLQSLSDAASGALADGLTEEIGSLMGQFEEFSVVACRKGVTDPTTADYSALSHRLGARFVLDGSVQCDEEVMKVFVRVIDGRWNRQIWAKSYHRAARGHHLIDTQEEIARRVAAEVASEYGLIAKRLSTESRQTAPEHLSASQAILAFLDYESEPSPESAARCLAALQATVTREPAYGPAWSALSVLMHNAYMLDLDGAEDVRGRPADYARRGAVLAPRSQLARAAMAQSYFVRKERDLFLREIELALQLNPASPLYRGATGYMLILAEEFERGFELLTSSTAMNAAHPSWFNHGLFVYHYHRGDYVRAYEETMKAAFDIHFWGPVLRIAALGCLGRIDEAHIHAARLEQLAPGFESRVGDLVRRPILSDAISQGILDGLRHAGLRV